MLELPSSGPNPWTRTRLRRELESMILFNIRADARRWPGPSLNMAGTWRCRARYARREHSRVVVVLVVCVTGVRGGQGRKRKGRGESGLPNKSRERMTYKPKKERPAPRFEFL